MTYTSTDFERLLTPHTTALQTLRDEHKTFEDKLQELLEGLNGLNGLAERVSEIESSLAQTPNQQSIAELEQLRHQNETLQSSNDQLQKEIIELKEALAKSKKVNEEQARITEKTPSVAAQVRKNPTIGVFQTTDVSRANYREKATKVIAFTSPYSAPPGLPLGLTIVDIGKDEEVRVSCFVSKVANNSFEVNINGSAKTKLHWSACAWLEIGASDPDFQFGRFSTLENCPWDTQACNKGWVGFSRPYDTPPKVVVWLTAFDMGREKHWRLKAYASDITGTGFKIHIDTWDDTVLRSATASWVAYTAGRTGICSGSFSTTDMRSKDHPQRFNNGYSTFPTGAFTATPRIFMAISSIYISRDANMRLKVKASSLTAAGMMWHLDSWSDTILYTASASYIALS